MEKSVTLARVAREAGVSASTVSRILNGTANVRDEKKEAVERVLARLNYRPNVLARSLASGRTMSVGVLTQDISSPFYGDTLRGIEQGLSGSGYHPIFTSGHWQAQEELEAVDLLLARKVDALIVLGGVLPDEKLREVAAKVPLVALGRSVPDLESQCLRLDNFKGAYLATQHLVELGHRAIAHIMGVPSHRDAQDRLAGYKAALADARVEFDPDLVREGDFMEASGFLAATRLVEGLRTFSAIFVANDQMAYGARLALFRKGLRVPEDVSIVGFDDLPSSSFTTPPLTTVAQPTYDIGLASAECVLRLLNGEEAALPPLDVQLVVRESTTRRRS
ncbi:LacI family DNA-binding transcriptional regulator [Deinococcus yavapaiensis]|uniref:LacI family transcriptional regulator n=1 Tax=Deinococcus yavapaiensis KR-236 TaxID=694435 RepID=A0A318S846_9DEIO|nr:substrate-binding domain-containing protein [Deinococcus yavapaiensis]PYE54622.1 LacI family transcriptional regulator [Deinococcus yavapaiensis KR-236]